jgi:hypothetical protein
MNILNLASHPDRLIGSECVAEQGAEEGISTYEDVCYGRTEKMLLWGTSQFLLLYHILLNVKQSRYRPGVAQRVPGR